MYNEQVYNKKDWKVVKEYKPVFSGVYIIITKDGQELKATYDSTAENFVCAIHGVPHCFGLTMVALFREINEGLADKVEKIRNNKVLVYKGAPIGELYIAKATYGKGYALYSRSRQDGVSGKYVEVMSIFRSKEELYLWLTASRVYSCLEWRIEDL